MSNSSAPAYQREREVAIAAALTAAQLCETVRSEQLNNAVDKPDASPVTIADYGSQALICRALAEAFPADPVVGEEDATLLQGQGDLLGNVTQVVGRFIAEATEAQVLDWVGRGKGAVGTGFGNSRFWTLDPIDGTKGYVRGDQYAIALALIENGEVQLGVVVCPALQFDAETTGTLFVAGRGQGAQMLSLDQQQSKALTVNGEGQRSSFRLIQSVVAAHGTPKEQVAAAQAVGITTEPLSMDSLGKYGAIARGDADLYLRLPSANSTHRSENIWDHAAGAIVLEEAGGRVSDRDGKALDFTSGIKMVGNVGVVASNGLLHDAVIKALE